MPMAARFRWSFTRRGFSLLPDRYVLPGSLASSIISLACVAFYERGRILENRSNCSVYGALVDVDLYNTSPRFCKVNVATYTGSCAAS